MKIFFAIVALLGFQISLAAESLPVGTIRRGTLANPQLIQDAKTGVAGKVGTLGCNTLGDVDTYVIAMPTGAPGSRHWTELWIVSGCNKKYPITIEFSEDGADANWTIR